MIRFEQVSVTLRGHGRRTRATALRGVDLEVPEGELCLLVGPSGVGKSTLLGTVSGLVPHFTGGTLHGRVTVAGRDTRTHKPRELADVVGTVGQDPLAHFVTDTVEDELAYGMESLGLPPGDDAPPRRGDPRPAGPRRAARPPHRHALRRTAAARRDRLGAHPAPAGPGPGRADLRARPGAAEEVLAVLQRLVHDLGTTVLMAEHRLERVVQYADQVLLLPAPGAAARLGDPGRASWPSRPVHPPVVALGRLAGWSPLPLSVRDARRRARPLREELQQSTQRKRLPGRRPDPAPRRRSTAARTPHPERPHARGAARRAAPRGVHACGCDRMRAPGPVPANRPERRRVRGRAARRVSGLSLRRGDVTALHGVDLTVHARRDGRADGPQRRGQVHTAQQPRGRARTDRRDRHGRRADASPPPHPARPSSCATSGSYRRSRATCCTRTRSPPSARQPTPTRGPRPAPAATWSARCCPASPTARTRAICRRDSGWPSRSRSSSPPARRCCCSTSPPAAWTTRRSPAWSAILRALAAGGPRASSWPPTTWSWPRSSAHRVVILAEGEIVADGPDGRGGHLLPRVRPAGRQVLAPARG